MKVSHSLNKYRETIWEQIVRYLTLFLMGAGIIIAITGNRTMINHNVLDSTIAIVFTVILLAVFTIFSKKTVDAYKTWLVVIFIIALTLRIIMLNTWPIEPTSDFKDTYNMALRLAESGMQDMQSIMRADNNYYYTTWSVHVPYILIEMAIIRLFGEGIYPIQVIFNIFSALSCVMTAMIAKCMYGRKAGIIAGIFMCVFPLNLMYSAVLTNQHIATFFFLGAIYFIIVRPMKRNLLNIAAAAVFTALSQLIRPEMQIFVIAVICYFLYRYIIGVHHKSHLKDAAKKFASYSVMFISVYLVLIFVVNLSMIQSGIVKNSITDTNYKYKIATGLNRETKGAWNSEDAEYADDHDALDKLIAQRSSDLGQVFMLGIDKLAFQYGTYNYSWCVEGKSGAFAERWYNPFTNDVMFIILILTLLRVIIALFRRSRRELFLMIVMVGYFLVFMIIEVQSRYNYFSIPIFTVFASGSIVYIYAEAGRSLKLAYKKFRKKILSDRI